MSQYIVTAQQELVSQGFCRLPADQWSMESAYRVGFTQIGRLFDGLPPDPYMKNLPTVRYRRHSSYLYDRTVAGLALLPAKPYRQDLANNSMFGGVDRSFEPIPRSYYARECIRRVVETCVEITGTPSESILIHAHLVRVVGNDDLPGDPSPEGMHRDGFDFVSIHLVRLHNADGGETTIRSMSGAGDAQLRLNQPADGVLIDDLKMFHLSSPIRPTKKGSIAIRDVLLLSYEALTTRPNKINSGG